MLGGDTKPTFYRHAGDNKLLLFESPFSSATERATENDPGVDGCGTLCLCLMLLRSLRSGKPRELDDSLCV